MSKKLKRTTELNKTGDLVMEFNQVSDYYPVDSGGGKLELADGTIVSDNPIAEEYETIPASG